MGGLLMSIQDTFPAMGRAALEYAEKHGWHVFPVPPGTKKSHKSAEYSNGRNWGATTDPAEIRRDRAKWPNSNVGIVTGPQSGFFVIDADTPEGHGPGKDGVGTLRRWIKEHGTLPLTPEAATPSDGWHIYFKWPEDMDIRNSDNELAPGIDVRGNGGMVLAPPSVKLGGGAYKWMNHPDFVDPAPAPQWLLDKIEVAQRPKLSERAAPIMPNTMTPAGLEELADMLDYIDPDAGGYGDWCNVLMGIHDHTDGGGDGLALAEQWSARGVKYDPGEVASKWQGFTSGGGVAIGTIAAIARQNGADLSAISRQHKKGKAAEIVRSQISAVTSDGPQPRSFEELMEAAKALEPVQIDEMEAIVMESAGLNPMRREAIFRAIKDATKVPLSTLRDQFSHGGDTGPDPDHLDLARITLNGIGRTNIICADAFVWQWSEAGVWKKQDARAIKQATQNVIDTEGVEVTASRVNGVTDVLKSEIFKPGHEFNLGNPEAVNCLNGELELQGGKWTLLPHCRENYRTTQIPVTYDRAADAPLFGAFLDQVFQDDADKTDKIKSTLELIGYTLMSHARHERFVMLIGPGANGKSVLLAVLEGLLGHENVAGVQPSNFENRFQRAHLHQKLANIVTELKQGEVIADAELKAITSGEAATVEHKHKDPFLMRPYSTCWFGTNHMPHTRDFSEALFRRATILQFNRTFAVHEQEPLLKEKLLAELPGILNMTLAAYAKALAKGFTQPQSSEAAKKDWRLEADQVAQFVDDTCQRLPGARTPVGDVFHAYQSWALENGIGKTMSQKGLRDRLTRLGFGADRDMKARYVTELKVTTIGWVA
jgi:putative DNA primase/helicase